MSSTSTYELDGSIQLRTGDMVRIISVLQDEGYPSLSTIRVMEMENLTAKSRGTSTLAGVSMVTPTIRLQPPTIGRVISSSVRSLLSGGSIITFTIEEGNFDDRSS